MATEATLFRSVIVWIDARTPEKVVLDEALDGAERFHAPVQLVMAEPFPNEASRAAALVRDFTEKCARHSLSCVCCQGRTEGTIRSELLGGPDDLLICGRALRPFLSAAVCERMLTDTAPSTLHCSRERQPWTQLLLLDEGRPFSNGCLRGLAELCRGLEASLVVLTLAASEAAGQRRQAKLQTAAAAVGLRAEFDLFVGHDPFAAVARVARWRHCEAVVRQRRSVSAWWNWLQRDRLDGLCEIEHAPAILELPDGWTHRKLSAVEPAAARRSPVRPAAEAVSVGRTSG